MKDIGLGIIDRYTVVIVLITLALIHTLFGLQIPVDSSNATNLLWSLTLFTGYLYFMRSLYHFPVAAIKAWIITDETYDLKGLISKPYSFRVFLSRILLLLVIPPISFLLIFVDYAEPYFDELYPSKRLKALNKRVYLRYILKILDRLGLVIVTIVAALPTMHSYVRILGIIGACFMIVIYLLKGNLTAILKDELNKREANQAEEDTQTSEDLAATDSPDEIYYSTGVSIAISHCVTCGKLCSEDGAGKVPRFCSLECRQKWYPTWEKDWCIGMDQERQIINGLRQAGYRDFGQVESAIKELETIATQSFATKESVWALLAVIRDSESEHQKLVQRNLQKMAFKALENILEQKPHFIDECVSAIFDESVVVTETVLKLIGKYQPPHRIKTYLITPLINHKEETIRLQAIEILGKLQEKQILLEHLGTIGIPESRKIIDTLKSIGVSAILELKQAQKSPIYGIREEATEALRTLGVEAEEPELVEDKITCPECQKKITISFSKEKDKIDVKKTNWIKDFFQDSDLKIQCPSCHAKLNVILIETPLHRLIRENQQASSTSREHLSTVDSPEKGY